jgi:division protein CdvB (Snf7/Vps24/ESCRT-III family)
MERVTNFKQGVCHTIVALPFTFKKSILKAKNKFKKYEKLKYFTMQKIYNLQKIALKKKPKSFKIL